MSEAVLPGSGAPFSGTYPLPAANTPARSALIHPCPRPRLAPAPALPAAAQQH